MDCNSASASLEYSKIRFSLCFVNENIPAVYNNFTDVFCCTLTIWMTFRPFSLLGSVWILILITFLSFLNAFVRALLETLYKHDFNGYAKVFIFSRI